MFFIASHFTKSKISQQHCMETFYIEFFLIGQKLRKVG